VVDSAPFLSCGRRKRAVAAAFIVVVVTAIGLVGPTSRAVAANPAATVIATYRARIPELMAEQHIPGLAVAIVDRNRALLVEGLGHVDGAGSAPVTAETIFSAESMSKLFTATAVIQAVAAGGLDLDAPITTYLPEFTVHSAFAKHPERKITLRMLLSHTAGFTHEAPVGNNNELDPGTFDAHVRSISDTWLRFPVGRGYAYSNLGIDLAGYILERVEGKPFAQVMRESLLEPLGMRHSTFDRAVIRSTVDRAVGHVRPYPRPPLDEPMTAAGGLYTSAADLARFLRFELNGGSIGDRVVLGSRWLREMQVVPSPHAGAPAGYALGVVRHRWNRWAQAPDLFEHGGGGYGFLTDIWWLPQLGVGVAVLTNSQDHQLQNELSLSILTDLVSAPGVYQDRLLALPACAPAAEANTFFDPPVGLAGLVADTAMGAKRGQAARWAAFAGLYRMRAWGYLELKGTPDRFYVDAGVPYFETDDNADAPIRHPLAEVKPGLFLADNGETLDLRGPVATWRNLRIVRVSGGPSGWQWAILAAAALAAATWLLAALRRSARRARGSRSLPTRQPTTTRRWRRVTAVMASASALITLGNVALLASIPGLVDTGYTGKLDLSLAEQLAVHLPLAIAILGTVTVALVASGWIRRWWPRTVTLQYAALAVAAVALVPLLAGWHLIGLT
jgi:CubicO group peptidase (beta-lactamase class C family)